MIIDNVKVGVLNWPSSLNELEIVFVRSFPNESNTPKNDFNLSRQVAAVIEFFLGMGKVFPIGSKQRVWLPLWPTLSKCVNGGGVLVH